MSGQIKFKADEKCDVCGNFGAYDFGKELLCSDCYCERGSCCVEFGGYDLWSEEKTDREKYNVNNSDEGKE